MTNPMTNPPHWYFPFILLLPYLWIPLNQGLVFLPPPPPIPQQIEASEEIDQQETELDIGNHFALDLASAINSSHMEEIHNHNDQQADWNTANHFAVTLASAINSSYLQE
ncbi:hypothetical protein VKT23_020643 [Stygiomarasmius scandens]|uniref:Uncharacterized protein n=1 Tax=Marasmiellus scandens TaxID=2682957 RepID=A0ABR1IKD7_9AGAR